MPRSHTVRSELGRRGGSLKPIPGTSSVPPPECRRGRSNSAGLAFCECPAPQPMQTRLTLLASSENIPGSSRVASFPHVLHPTAVFSKSPFARIPLGAPLSFGPGGLGAETFSPLGRRRWWLEGGRTLRPGRWVRAWKPGTSAFGSTRLHLGYSPAAARLGKACCKSLSWSRKNYLASSLHSELRGHWALKDKTCSYCLQGARSLMDYTGYYRAPREAGKGA